LKEKASEESMARVKTAFIYNFTKYIYWPHEDEMKEFRICVLSSQKLYEQLNEITALVKFRNRVPIRITQAKITDDLAKYQMVIADGNSGDNLWTIYSKIRGRGILMVTENLEDYKKSTISFIVVDNKMKFIINKTKMDESNLVVNERLYALAITKEGEWRSIFDKFHSLLESNGKEVSVDKSELRQMMSMYSDLEKDKLSNAVLMARMEDSLREKVRILNGKMEEYKIVNQRIDEQKRILKGLGVKMYKQKREISLRETQIGQQRTVISIIGGLAVVVILLLLVALRTNAQRRKANKLLSVQKNEIEKQKYLVDLKQKEILDSINYAKRIQTALMASDKMLGDNLPQHFVLFKPKDIVAGDFYWAAPLHDGFLYITADSTGHGVPGAFMSLLNISKLNDAINQKKIYRPDLVLNEVKEEIIKALNPEGSTEESKDGMDATLCKLNLQQMKLQYAAANNSFCIVRNHELLVCKADKMPVGKSHDDHALFTYNEVALQKNDMVYTFTDGYSDQFGGPEGKKLKLKKLKEKLVAVSLLNLQEQREELKQFFLDWKGTLEQVDDVLVIGVRV
jgi:serine phosphatase RsbU (regulator of sigma subunit)